VLHLQLTCLETLVQALAVVVQPQLLALPQAMAEMVFLAVVAVEILLQVHLQILLATVVQDLLVVAVE
jgi:hypothetical protein